MHLVQIFPKSVPSKFARLELMTAHVLECDFTEQAMKRDWNAIVLISLGKQ